MVDLSFLTGEINKSLYKGLYMLGHKSDYYVK